jgi:hypothetical protein
MWLMRYAGYVWAALRVIWTLKKLWFIFLLLAADAGNAWTDKCFTEDEGRRLYQDWWRLMVEGGFTCRPAKPPLD